MDDIRRRDYQAKFLEEAMRRGYTVPTRHRYDPVGTTTHMSSRHRNAVKRFIHDAPEQSFDDIVGNEVALSQLKEAITAPVENKELYESYGMKAPKGAVLHGPPGCGKTMFARAAATEMRRLYGKGTEYLLMSGPELQGGFVGQTEELIRSIFGYARDYKDSTGHPLLVFIDEAEAILPEREREPAYYRRAQVAEFLSQMDGVVESGAFVLLATNQVSAIDQALLRDGRCDFKIEIKRPTLDAAEEILRRGFTSAPKLGESVPDLTFAAVESLADPGRVIFGGKLEGKEVQFTLADIISGAMVTSVITRSTRHAFSRDKRTGTVTGITTGDVIAAVDDIFRENKNLPHTHAMTEFVRNRMKAEK